MPPRRSQRNKRPSQQALEAVASSSSPRRRRRQEEQSTNEASEVMVPPVSESGPSALLPPNILAQIVSTVTDEVTKRIANQRGLSQPGELPVQTRELPIVGCRQPADVEAGASLHGAVASIASVLAGETQSSATSPQPQQVFSSISMPVDARVPLKLKTKIWQEQYIDFGSLLVNPTHNGRYQLTVQTVLGEGSSPSLALEPITKPKKIFSIDTWLQAFHVFVGIYTSKNPQAAPSLMKYGSIIQDLAARGHNWRFYNENFRFLRQTPSTCVPWGNIHWELWLMSQSSPHAKKSQPSGSTGKLVQSVNVPRGYCYKYHRGGDCSGVGCPFKHNCCKCEGPHRALHCNFRAFNRSQGTTSLARGSPKHTNGPSPQQAPPPSVANTRKN